MKKYTYKFGKDFDSDGGALTLSMDQVTRGHNGWGVRHRTHKDGWTIKGEIHEDYFFWVNEFEATHPKLGKVWGDFEKEVYATSRKAFKDFYAKHPPHAWDYADI